MPGDSGATLLDDLPESLIIWEIFIRLPPKDALRCRAVRKSWRRASSTPDFLLAHHRRQLSLPVIKHYPEGAHHLAVFRDSGDGNQKLLPVLRYTTPRTDSVALQLHASGDGLLVVSNEISRERVFYVCNPATRQCAPLPQLAEHGPRGRVLATSMAGLYLHHPSGEHRVLYSCWAVGSRSRDRDFYIMSIGSDQPSRFIGRPPSSSSPPSVEEALLKGLPYCDTIAPVLHRGGLHWDLGRHAWYYTAVPEIMVFDTTVETFRWLRRPPQAPLGVQTLLSEMDGALALFSARNGVVVDVFVMQDYEEEVWALRYRIDLSAVVKLLQHELMMVVVNDRELFFQLPGRLLHCDIDGEVIGFVECPNKEGHLHPLYITTHWLQESMLPLDFERGTGASNDPPFVLGH